MTQIIRSLQFSHFALPFESTQDRFLLRRDPNSTDTHVYRWWVPLTYSNSVNRTRRSDWMSNDEATKTITSLGASANDWVIFNIDQQSL